LARVYATLRTIAKQRTLQPRDLEGIALCLQAQLRKLRIALNDLQLQSNDVPFAARRRWRARLLTARLFNAAAATKILSLRTICAIIFSPVLEARRPALSAEQAPIVAPVKWLSGRQTNAHRDACRAGQTLIRRERASCNACASG
jgi:hypothetical protein